MISVLLEHRRVLLTLGLGVLIISAARATRQSIVPLWAESIGLSAATTSLIFGISAGSRHAAVLSRRRDHGPVRPGIRRRAVHDRARARLLLLPLTTGAAGDRLVAALMGLGNGISSGIVMTLGADASPPRTAAPSSSVAGGCAAIWATPRPADGQRGHALIAPLAAARRSRWAAHLGGLGVAGQLGAAYASEPTLRTQRGAEAGNPSMATSDCSSGWTAR